MKRRFKITTKANLKAKVVPNLLQQDFTAYAPNQRWVADFTYVATLEGWLYVAIILNLFSRKIIGLAMHERMTSGLVLSALTQAFLHRQPQAGLVHHYSTLGYVSPVELENQWINKKNSMFLLSIKRLQDQSLWSIKLYMKQTLN